MRINLTEALDRGRPFFSLLRVKNFLHIDKIIYSTKPKQNDGYLIMECFISLNPPREGMRLQISGYPIRSTLTPRLVAARLCCRSAPSGCGYSSACKPASTRWLAHSTTRSEVTLLWMDAKEGPYPRSAAVGHLRDQGEPTIVVDNHGKHLLYSLDGKRRTQLAGLLILPVIMLFSWKIFQARGLRWPLIITGWVLFAGLALTHYRILIIGLLFLLAVVVIYTRKANFWENLSKTAILGLGSFGLFLPWLFNVFGGGIYRIFSNQVTTPPKLAAEFIHQYNSTTDFQLYIPMIALVSVIVIIIIGLWRRDVWAGILAVWIGAVWLATNPAILGLPGSGLISNFTIIIT